MSEYCPQPNDPENNRPDSLRSFENDPEYPPDGSERFSDNRIEDPKKAHEMALASDDLRTKIAITRALMNGIRDKLGWKRNDEGHNIEYHPVPGGVELNKPDKSLDDWYTLGRRYNPEEEVEMAKDEKAAEAAQIAEAKKAAKEVEMAQKDIDKLGVQADAVENEVAAGYDAEHSGN